MLSTTPNIDITHIDLSEWPTLNPDDRINIIINLSLNEYIAIAQTIDIGRDIAYGDNSIYIWWLWSRMLESMSICTDIINCIETTPDLQSIIQSTVNGTPDTGGQNSRIISDAFDVDGCNNDVTYGYVKALWQYINATTIDALQILSEATNKTEQVSKFITAIIPGSELLPVDEVLGWIDQFGNYNLEAYEASITVGLEDEIICDLFCLAVNNDCSIDFGTVYDYFIDKLGGVNMPTATAVLLEWMQFMVTGAYPTDRIVYMWSAFQLGLAFMGQKFLGLSTIGRYSLIAQTGDADTDWQLLCPSCGTEWVRVFMGLLNSDDPTAFGWTSPHGFFSTSGAHTVWRDTVDGPNVASELIYEFTQPLILNRWFARVNTAIQGANHDSYIQVLDNLDNILHEQVVSIPAGNTVVDLDLNNIDVQIIAGYKVVVRTEANGAGVALILGIQVEGTGTPIWPPA
jgi:hypothetical protein